MVGHGASDVVSGRWQGRFTFSPGTYRFTVGSNDGVRVRINNVLRLNQWTFRNYTERTFDQVFSTTSSVPIEVDYFDAVADVRLKVGVKKIR